MHCAYTLHVVCQQAAKVGCAIIGINYMKLQIDGVAGKYPGKYGENVASAHFFTPYFKKLVKAHVARVCGMCKKMDTLSIFLHF
jgi:hypothetical protein